MLQTKLYVDVSSAIIYVQAPSKPNIRKNPNLDLLEAKFLISIQISIKR